MALQYTVTLLPPVWPGVKRASGIRSPFKTQWTGTLELLNREIKKLRGSHVEIAVELTRGARDIRNDGQLRSDALPKRSVIVSFRTPKGERLQFPCDTYGFWQDNVYAIAKTLENLRAIDRWGATQSRQYEGFKALPSSTTVSVDDAIEILIEDTLYTGRELYTNKDVAKVAVRGAIHRTHPDRNGGERSAYDRVDAARKVLSTHHGVTL